MKLVKNISRDQFYKSYYTTMNGLLKLTNLELDTFVKFSEIQSSGDNPLSKENRKLVARTLGITTYNLNNYISMLKDKGLIVYKDTWILNPNIYLSNDKSSYEINFKFNII